MPCVQLIDLEHQRKYTSSGNARLRQRTEPKAVLYGQGRGSSPHHHTQERANSSASSLNPKAAHVCTARVSKHQAGTGPMTPTGERPQSSTPQQTPRLKKLSCLKSSSDTSSGSGSHACLAIRTWHVINAGPSLLQSLWAETWITRYFCWWGKRSTLLCNSTSGKSLCSRCSTKRRF